MLFKPTLYLHHIIHGFIVKYCIPVLEAHDR